MNFNEEEGEEDTDETPFKALYARIIGPVIEIVNKLFNKSMLSHRIIVTHPPASDS
jgi:hypothetical protein